MTAKGYWVQDKVIQTENDHDKDVFNGDIGQIVKIDPVEREVTDVAAWEAG